MCEKGSHWICIVLGFPFVYHMFWNIEQLLIYMEEFFQYAYYIFFSTFVCFSAEKVLIYY